MRRHVEPIDRELDAVVHLLAELHVVRLEAIEAEDDDWGCAEELQLLDAVAVGLAFGAVPGIS